MQYDFALSVIGAMFAATLGGMICRWCFAVKYNFLLYLWLTGFIAVFAILFVLIDEIIFRGGFRAWILSALACSVLPVFHYAGYRYCNRIPAVGNERLWRIAYGLLLHLCGAGMVMTARWWIKEIADIMGWNAVMAFLSCAFLLTFGGLLTLTLGRDNKSAKPYRVVLELVRFPFEWLLTRPSLPGFRNRRLHPESAKTGASIESLFSAALGLAAPWEVDKVELSTPGRRIDFDLNCKASRLNCPQCGAADQAVHDRVRMQWRYIDCFQHQAWLCANVPRVSCSACEKTSQLQIPWAAKSGST